MLRGHEGGPLVIGDMMYVHAPFPNSVFALDLNNDGKMLWKLRAEAGPDRHRRDVLRHGQPGVAYADGKIFLTRRTPPLVALDAKTGKEVWKVKNGDPTKGETGTTAPMVVKDKVLIGISGGEYGIRGHLTAYDLAAGKLAWRAYSVGPDNEMLFDPQKTTAAGQAGRRESRLGDLGRRSVEDRRRLHLGLVLATIPS